MKETLHFCEQCGAALEGNDTGTPVSNNGKRNKHGRTGLPKKYTVVIVIFVIVVSAGFGYLYSQNSLLVQSDPPGAEVYFDSGYKGTSPCVITTVFYGVHHLELRHENYPAWEKNITISLGQAITITADLSDNLIPAVTLACRSRQTSPGAPANVSALNKTTGNCVYALGEGIELSGSAVRPHPKQNPNLRLSVKTPGQDTLSARDYDVKINDDFTYNYTISGRDLSRGNYRVTATLPSGQSTDVVFSIESEADANTRILQQIVKDYHAIHTYSIEDYYICADMAQDVWNIVDTQGIPALLVAGNIENPETDRKNYNHAWVIAEVSPGQWIALETTAGNLVTRMANPNYFKGIFFKNPKDMKTYLDYTKEYNNELERLAALQQQYTTKLAEYNAELDNYNSLVSDYNTNYANRQLLPAAYQASVTLKNNIAVATASLEQKKSGLDQISSAYTSEKEIMTSVTSQLDALATKGNTLVNF